VHTHGVIWRLSPDSEPPEEEEEAQSERKEEAVLGLELVWILPLAVSLLGLGLRPGDRVASLMPNRPALIVHYLACWKAGLVATHLNYRYKAPEIDHALAVSEARALLAHVDREEDLAASQLVQQLPLGTISYGGKQGAGPSFDELVEGEASSSPPPPPSSGCTARGATPSRRRCSGSSPR
jgi:hypothetical protein